VNSGSGKDEKVLNWLISSLKNLPN